MTSTSRPDLAPRNSPEWMLWREKYQERQIAKQQQQQERDARQFAQIVERKRASGQYI